MRTGLVLLLVALSVLHAGCIGTTGGDAPPTTTAIEPVTATPTAADVGTATASTTSSPTATSAGTALLLSRDEVFETDPLHHHDAGDFEEVDLYYVAGNGTWYHARPDGSIGARASRTEALELATVVYDNGTRATETLALESPDWPRYVWTLDDTCEELTLVDAETGRLVASHPPPPGCAVLEAMLTPTSTDP
jgi:hypothetical protein